MGKNEWEHEPGRMLTTLSAKHCPFVANYHWEILRRHVRIAGVGGAAPPQAKSQWTPWGWGWHFLDCIQRSKEQRRMEAIRRPKRDKDGKKKELVSLRYEDSNDDVCMEWADERLKRKQIIVAGKQAKERLEALRKKRKSWEELSEEA